MSKILFDETGAASYKKKAKEQLETAKTERGEQTKEKKQVAPATKTEKPQSTIKKKQAAPIMRVVAPEKTETRSKALNFRVRPSLNRKFEEKCKEVGVTKNSAIEQLIEIFCSMED